MSVTLGGGDESATQEVSPKTKKTEEKPKASEGVTFETAGAPVVESPEKPVAPTVQVKSTEPVLETPEEPIEPEAREDEDPEDSIPMGVTLASDPPILGANPSSFWTNYDNNSDAPTMVAIDTGIASAPYDRPSSFSPTGTTGTTPAPTRAQGDTGIGSTPTSRATVFDPPQTVTVYIDPGAF